MAARWRRAPTISAGRWPGSTFQASRARISGSRPLPGGRIGHGGDHRLVMRGAAAEDYKSATNGRAVMERKPERKKASDFPQELLNLLDGYVHGGVSRRQFLDRAQQFAVGGITAMALFEMLRPNYAWAIQIQPDDKRIKTSTESLQSPESYGTVQGYLAAPANDTKQPSISISHENRGLNPHIYDVDRVPPVETFVSH